MIKSFYYVVIIIEFQLLTIFQFCPDNCVLPFLHGKHVLPQFFYFNIDAVPDMTLPFIWSFLCNAFCIPIFSVSNKLHIDMTASHGDRTHDLFAEMTVLPAYPLCHPQQQPGIEITSPISHPSDSLYEYRTFFCNILSHLKKKRLIIQLLDCLCNRLSLGSFSASPNISVVQYNSVQYVSLNAFERLYHINDFSLAIYY